MKRLFVAHVVMPIVWYASIASEWIAERWPWPCDDERTPWWDVGYQFAVLYQAGMRAHFTMDEKYHVGEWRLVDGADAGEGEIISIAKSTSEEVMR